VRSLLSFEAEDVFAVDGGGFGAGGDVDLPVGGAVAGDGVDGLEGSGIVGGGIGAPVIAGEGELEVPADIECARGEGRGGEMGGIEADEGAVGEFADPGMVAEGPELALNLMDGLGDVAAVFLVAVLADLLGALLEGAVFAGGEKEKQKGENYEV